MTSHRPPDTAGPGTVAEIGERALIDRIGALIPEPPAWVHVPVGDDCAVVEPARNTLDVVTTDAMVEGVHFDRRYVGAGDVGFKVLAASLSDLAAMGAAPRSAVLSLTLPDALPVADVEALVRSLVELAVRHGVALVGGNVARSPGPLHVDVTAIGAVRRRRILRRAGAGAGDELWLSGTVGGADAGQAWLAARCDGGTRGAPAGAGAPRASADLEAAAARFLRPEPRVRLGTLLGRNRAASACIDLSDGLAAALHQLAEAGGVGLAIDGEAVPVDAGVRAWHAARDRDALDEALHGGEDYELLFTVPRKHRGRFRHVRSLVGDLPLTRIGVVRGDARVVMTRAGTEVDVPAGFAHFG